MAEDPILDLVKDLKTDGHRSAINTSTGSGKFLDSFCLSSIGAKPTHCVTKK